MSMKMNPTPPFESARYVGSLPRNWELAYGYRIERPARWIAAYWQPAGDEAMVDDGRTSFDANWSVYLDLVSRRLRLPLLVSRTLGNSDEYATHCLLIDLKDRHIFVAPLSDTERFLHHQHDWTPKHDLPDISTEVVMRAIREAFDQEMERRARMATVICRKCLHGYLLAADWGYDPCPQCHGDNVRLVPPDQAEDLDGEWDIIYPATYRLEGEGDVV
ncbi:hypothetical protein HYR99_14935 [Candidatus Poribacteria bacterium]|nr:hypothetical protein [Candidatus Poribacteria bacterium]